MKESDRSFRFGNSDLMVDVSWYQLAGGLGMLLMGFSLAQILVILSIFPSPWVLQLSQLVRWGRHSLLSVVLLGMPFRLLEGLLFLLRWLVGKLVLLGLGVRGKPWHEMERAAHLVEKTSVKKTSIDTTYI
jgi:hypothetical protein